MMVADQLFLSVMAALLVGLSTVFYRRIISELDVLHKCMEQRIEKTDMHRVEILVRIAAIEAQIGVFKIGLDKLVK